MPDKTESFRGRPSGDQKRGDATLSGVALNENHQRRLRATFQHVDKLLAEAEQVMAFLNAASPFQLYTHGISRSQRKIIKAQVIKFREMMVETLKNLKIPLVESRVSARGALSSIFDFADIELEEAGPDHLKGYGPLSENAAECVDKLLRDLRAALGRIRCAL